MFWLLLCWRSIFSYPQFHLFTFCRKLFAGTCMPVYSCARASHINYHRCHGNPEAEVMWQRELPATSCLRDIYWPHVPKGTHLSILFQIWKNNSIWNSFRSPTEVNFFAWAVVHQRKFSKVRCNSAWTQKGQKNQVSGGYLGAISSRYSVILWSAQV